MPPPQTHLLHTLLGVHVPRGQPVLGPGCPQKQGPCVKRTSDSGPNRVTGSKVENGTQSFKMTLLGV